MRFFPLLFLLLPTLAAVGQPASVEPAERFGEVVTYLASPELQGRDAGTAGLDVARDFIAEWFCNSGLQPGFRAGREAVWTEPFDVSLGVEPIRQSLQLLAEAVANGGRVFTPGVSGDFNALGFSGEAEVMRSDFGLGGFAPDVSDAMDITVAVEAFLQD